MQLSDFKTYVKYDFKRTDKDTELVQFYNDMIMWVALQIPHGNYKFQSYITLTDGTEDYPLPTDGIHLYHPIKFLEGTAATDHGRPLVHVNKDKYDRLSPNPNRTSPDDKGQPTHYTVYSRSILLWPIPDDATEIIEINWSKRVTDMSADSDVPSIGAEWDEVFKWGTLERLYASIGMTEEAREWASKYRDQEGNPIGVCKKLFDIEIDREEEAIGQVEFTDL